jgi:hypothetical protein
MKLYNLKNQNKMKTRITLLLMLISVGIFAQHDHHAATANQETKAIAQFKDAKLGAAYDQYIQLKDALVASNAEQSKKIATGLQKSLIDLKAPAKTTAAMAALLKATDLEGQRLAFSDLSNEMATLVKGGKLSAGSLFLEYCPMANSNTGAYWLSNEKEIKNPYFGSMMLKCGSVKETIQ